MQITYAERSVGPFSAISVPLAKWAMKHIIIYVIAKLYINFKILSF